MTSLLKRPGAAVPPTLPRMEIPVILRARHDWPPAPTAFLSAGMIAAAVLMATLPHTYPDLAIPITASIINTAGLIGVAAAIFAPVWARFTALWMGIWALGASALLLIPNDPGPLYCAPVLTGWLLLKSSTLVVATYRSPTSLGKGWLMLDSMFNLILASLAIIITSPLVLVVAVFGQNTGMREYSVLAAASMLISGLSGMAVAAQTAWGHALARDAVRQAPSESSDLFIGARQGA